LPLALRRVPVVALALTAPGMTDLAVSLTLGALTGFQLINVTVGDADRRAPARADRDSRRAGAVHPADRVCAGPGKGSANTAVGHRPPLTAAAR
jgi:hypothetical protein